MKHGMHWILCLLGLVAPSLRRRPGVEGALFSLPSLAAGARSGTERAPEGRVRRSTLRLSRAVSSPGTMPRAVAPRAARS
jgi:hypothetical protein